MSEAAANTADFELSISDAELEQLVDFMLVKGGTLAELRGITRDELEGIYAIAYSELGQKHFQKAEELYTFLCLFDHNTKKNWMGLGVSRQMTEKYRDAVAAYYVGASKDLDDPAPALKTGECFLAVGELEKAERAFKTAAHLASQEAKFEGLKKSAEAMLTAVDNRRTTQA
ncbi:MAG: SycD/LcrH family type III secretion system chaperone [Pseudomonadota bacterium]